MIQHAILGGSKWCQYLTWPENTASSKIVDLLPMSIRAWKEGNICLCIHIYIYAIIYLFIMFFIYFPSGNQTYLAGKSPFFIFNLHLDKFILKSPEFGGASIGCFARSLTSPWHRPVPKGTSLCWCFSTNKISSETSCEATRTPEARFRMVSILVMWPTLKLSRNQTWLA